MESTPSLASATHRRRYPWVTATVILVVVFGYYFLSFTGFPNDHFVYVARAQQMLMGAWPLRDFVDPGFFLMYGASAAGLRIFGHNLLGEALLVSGGFAAAAALTYGLVRAASGSILVALVGVSLQALAYPRSYSYPKLALHALAITLCWEYLTRPTLARRIGLAALVVVAFLFRPDHGVVIGLASLVAIISAAQGTFWERTRTALGFAGVTGGFFLPWLIYVQRTSGVSYYLRSLLGFTGRKAEVGAMEWPPFPIELAPAAGQPGGLDHEAFLYYAFLLMPIAGAVALWRRGAAAAPMPDATCRLQIVIGIAMFTNLTLLRDPLRNRLADVAVPQAILAAWLLPTAWRAVRGWSLPVRFAQRTGITIIAGLLALSTIRLGAAADRLGDIPTLRPAALFKRAALVTWGLRHLDESSGIPRPLPVPPLVPYLQQCTAPDDRVMYVGYAPETYVFSHRGFAGGHVVFEGAYYSSTEEQTLTVGRLQRERIPVIAMLERSASDFRHTFSKVAGYIDANYERVGSIKLPGNQQEILFADRRRTRSGVYEPLGLPCFTPR